MTEQHDKSGSPLQQDKPPHDEQFRRELNTQLARFSDQLYALLNSHRFYQEALLALVQDNHTPDRWLDGATYTNQWLTQSGHGLLEQIDQTRTGLRPPQ